MFKHLIKIFILSAGLCGLTPAFATICITSAKFTQGVGGPTVTNLNLTTSNGTINNLVLEINFDQFGAIPTASVLANDFCSLTYGKSGAQFRNGNAPPSTTNYWIVTYGVATKSISNSSCASSAYDYFVGSPTPFKNDWLENVTGGNPANTKAEVFYYTSGASYSYLCNNTKLHIPLTIQYGIGGFETGYALGFTVTVLYNIVGGCCNSDTTGSTYTKTGTDLILRKITGSCSVTAPSLDLGTFKPTVTRTAGILGGVLKSTTVTLNCPGVYWPGVYTAPKVTITDAGNAGNTSCNPSNTAANGSNAFVALFTSSAIDDSPAGRYCVSSVDYNGSIINTMTFPQITSTTYTASKTIYAGLRYNDTLTSPSVGPVTSTLTLTVTYN